MCNTYAILKLQPELRGVEGMIGVACNMVDRAAVQRLAALCLDNYPVMNGKA